MLIETACGSTFLTGVMLSVWSGKQNSDCPGPSGRVCELLEFLVHQEFMPVPLFLKSHRFAVIIALPRLSNCELEFS
jgi:hypothetical protein